MNIKQNIVRIKTSNQIGSGIIYPCESEIKEFDITKYIVFTNRHIINDLETVKNKDLNKVLDIDIYDNNGNLINIDDSESVKLELFNPSSENKDEIKEDIAAILITFNYKLKLNLVNKIFFNDNDIDDLCVEGFPQVLYNNNISSKIELKGKYKEIFPKNKKLGVFQITDDYHWYSNYKDLRLFQGFSGGPIYKKADNTTYLVGLNQSLLNLNEGENPFKLLYYYKFSYVLEYLREKGCIIFKRNSDSSVSIRWKASIKKDINNEEDSENKIDEKELSKINILLLGASGAGKSSFVKTFLLHKDCVDSVNDGQTTRTNVVYKLSLFNKSPQAIVHFLDILQFGELMKELFYEKYLLKVMSVIEKKEFKNIKDCIKVVNEYENLSSKNKKKYKNENQKKGKMQTQLSERESLIRNIDEYIHNKHISNNGNEKLNTKYYKEVLSDLCNSYSCVFSFKELDFLNLGEIDCLSFDISLENYLSFFDNNNDNYTYNEFCFDVYFFDIYQKILSQIEYTYKVAKFPKGKIYNMIYTGTVCMNIVLNNDLDTIDLLSKCLQQKNNSSLTGIIDYVEIIDSISNEYAFILDDLEIDELTIVDSVGIDHDSYYTKSGNILSKNLDKLISNNLISFKSDSAVIYLKKLDAGKPTELKNIIPLIFNKVPQSPVYCVFNGLDIFLGSKVGEFNGFSYMCDKPKSIKYLENAETEILSMLKKDTHFSQSLYNTLKNNISCFCSEEDIINNNFNIYHYNRTVVYDLLLSICMKEYSCMNIIPKKLIRNIEDNKFGKKIKGLFKILYNEFTDEENIRYLYYLIVKSSNREDTEGKIKEESDSFIYALRGKLIHDLIKAIYDLFLGIFRLFISRHKNLLSVSNDDKYYNCVPSLDSCVKNMENSFIVCLIKEILIYIDFPFFTRDKVEIYEMKSTFPFNYNYLMNLIFEEHFQILEERNFYVHLVECFKKLEKFAEFPIFAGWCEKCFANCLLDTIEKDNKSKSENLMKINYKFYRQLQEIKYEFEKKYENIEFNDLLKYYASNKEKS